MTEPKKIGGYVWDEYIRDGKKRVKATSRALQRLSEKYIASVQGRRYTEEIALAQIELMHILDALEDIGDNWKKERINNGKT